MRHHLLQSQLCAYFMISQLLEFDYNACHWFLQHLVLFLIRPCMHALYNRARICRQRRAVLSLHFVPPKTWSPQTHCVQRIGVAPLVLKSLPTMMMMLWCVVVAVAGIAAATPLLVLPMLLLMAPTPSAPGADGVVLPLPCPPPPPRTPSLPQPCSAPRPHEVVLRHIAPEWGRPYPSVG